LSAYLDLSSEAPSFLSSVFSSPLDSPSASPSAPSAPSVVSPPSPSSVSSFSGSGSTSIVGGTRVATTKSLSVIVVLTPSGKLILLIFIASPISLLIKSNCN